MKASTTSFSRAGSGLRQRKFHCQEPASQIPNWETKEFCYKYRLNNMLYCSCNLSFSNPAIFPEFNPLPSPTTLLKPWTNHLLPPSLKHMLIMSFHELDMFPLRSMLPKCSGIWYFYLRSLPHKLRVSVKSLHRHLPRRALLKCLNPSNPNLQAPLVCKLFPI